MTQDITPDLLLSAYTQGVFPMADRRDDPEIFWVSPKLRGIFPLGGFHISRSLRRRLARDDYSLTIDHSFAKVVTACAARSETWISHRIAELYAELHHLGHAHSLEVWMDDTLAGGVYGVAIGGAFFGESMFSHRRDGSKIALAALVEHLNRQGFSLFDTQFLTPHLKSLGAIEIPQKDYLSKLQAALAVTANFGTRQELKAVQSCLQRRTQTS